MANLASTLLIILAVGISTSCGVTDRIDNRLDCKQICDRYAECFNADYDVVGCKTDCRDNANTDSSFESKVETCSDCLDADNSCTKDAFACTKDCVGIVP